MKISSTTSPATVGAETSRTRAPAAAPPQSGATSAARVDISALSAQLQEAGASEAPIDAQRVDEIRQAIAQGRFQIDPERIADGLLASVRDMLTRAGK